MTSRPGLTWDPAEAASVFDLGLPLGDPQPIARGAMGWIWRLETSQGSFAIKQLFHPTDEQLVSREVRFVRRARDAGVGAPAVFLTRDGEVLAIVASTEDRRRPVQLRAYEWIDAARSPESPASAADAGRAGEALAVMHAVGEATAEAPDDWYRHVYVGDTWMQTEASLRRTDERALADVISEAMDRLLTLENTLVDRAGPRMICHRDFDPENVLVDADDRFVIVDWEDAGPLDPTAEIAYSLLSWTTNANGEPEGPSTGAFFEGYARRRALSVPDGPAVFSVAIATRLNYIRVLAQIVTDGSASAHDKERARSVAMLVVERLPTEPLIEYFLDRWCETAERS